MATSTKRTHAKLPAQSTESFDVEERTIREKHERLLQRYEGKFIALYHGRIVGHGTDDEKLAEQMFEKLGDVPFYITRVEREPTVYDLPSPENVR